MHSPLPRLSDYDTQLHQDASYSILPCPRLLTGFLHVSVPIRPAPPTPVTRNKHDRGMQVPKPLKTNAAGPEQVDQVALVTGLRTSEYRTRGNTQIGTI